jgi:hypothetical protein
VDGKESRNPYLELILTLLRIIIAFVGVKANEAENIP